MVLGQYRAVMADIWWHWGSTGWYLVILGQYNLVLFGIKWYWANKGLLCLFILKKKLMVTSTDQPTDRPTNRQGEYRSICLFRKLENRKKAEICNTATKTMTTTMTKTLTEEDIMSSIFEILMTQA